MLTEKYPDQSYGNGARTTAPTPPGLLGQTVGDIRNASARVNAIRSELENIADSTFGASPAKDGTGVAGIPSDSRAMEIGVALAELTNVINMLETNVVRFRAL